MDRPFVESHSHGTNAMFARKLTKVRVLEHSQEF